MNDLAMLGVELFCDVSFLVHFGWPAAMKREKMRGWRGRRTRNRYRWWFSLSICLSRSSASSLRWPLSVWSPDLSGNTSKIYRIKQSMTSEFFIPIHIHGVSPWRLFCSLFFDVFVHNSLLLFTIVVIVSVSINLINKIFKNYYQIFGVKF